MSEEQTCPVRNAVGPWKNKGPDAWDRTRWTSDHDIAEAKRRAFLDENPGGSCSDIMDEWVWDTPKPRTCTYCGGIHPEDALMLLRNGWRVGATDKGYKRYLNPPDGRSPVPPVKLYTWHLNDAQTRQFNDLLCGRAPVDGSAP